MTRRGLGFFLFAVLAGSVGVLIARDPGYVLLAWSDYSLETSIWFAAALLLLTLLLLRGLLAALALLFGSRHSLHVWHEKRRRQQALRGTRTGLLAMIHGDFVAARKALAESAPYAPLPIVNHLEAARAAQALGDLKSRDQCLDEALAALPRATLAIGLTRAELQIECGQGEQALVALREWRRKAPRNARLLQLLRRACEQQADWQGLLSLIPNLRRSGGLTKEEVTGIQRNAWAARLRQMADDEDTVSGRLTAIRTLWGQVPKALQTHPDLVVIAAPRLDQLGDGQGAETLVEASLKKHWQAHLIEVYGRLEGADPRRRAKVAAGWAQTHKDDAPLTLARARLAQRCWHFGEAQDHYAASLALHETTEVCAEFGRLLIRLGDIERGTALLTRALQLGTSPPLELPLPRANT